MNRRIGLLIAWLLMALPGMVGAEPVTPVPQIFPAGQSGLSFYRPGVWGVVSTTFTNSTDQPTTYNIVCQLETGSRVQFGTKVWVPGRARRTVFLPIRLPEGAGDGKAALLDTILIDQSSGQDRILAKSQSMLRIDDSKAPTAAAISDPDEPDGRSLKVPAAARMAVFQTSRMAYPRISGFPWFSSGLSVLDMIVISSKSPVVDSLQISAIRDWLFNGGRLWIMADRVSPEFCERLLGSEWDVTAVDQVDITTLKLEGLGEPVTREFESPVTMTRVLSPSMKALQRVNGWPASLVKPVGRGQLIVTTLSPMAWLKRDEMTANEGLQRAAQVFIKAAERSPLKPKAFEPVLADQIGYRIVGRPVVASAMLGLLALVLVSAIVLARRGQVQWLAPITVVATLVAAGVLVVVGQSKRAAVPQMVATGQMVTVIPEVNRAVVSGMMSIYSPQGGPATIRQKGDASFWPDIRGKEAQISRQLMLDTLDRTTEELTLPAGAVKTVDMDGGANLPDPPRLTAQLDADGLSGKLEPGTLGAMEDLVIAAPAGYAAASMTGEGQWRVDPGAATSGRVLQGNLTSLSRQGREAIYQQLLVGKSYPSRPVLLGWAKPLDIGVRLEGEAEQRGAALVEIPLSLSPAKPGTPVRVPWYLLNMREYRQGKTSIGNGSTFFNPVTQQWSGSNNMAAKGLLRFQLPREVLPFELSGAVLRIDIKASDRIVEVAGLRGVDVASNSVVEGGAVQTLRSPNGLTQVDLGGAGAMEVDREGCVWVRVTVLATEKVDAETGAAPYWDVKGIWLDLRGAVKGGDGGP